MTLLEKIIEPRFQIDDGRKRFSDKDIIKLAYPILIDMLFALLVGMVDTLMVSYAGEAAVSGVSLVNQVNAMFIFVFGSVGQGGGVVISQYVGSSEREKGITAASQLLNVITVISVILMVISLTMRNALLGFLYPSVEASVMEASLKYLVVTAMSYPFIAMYNASAGMFRAMGDTKTNMKASIVVNIINVVGNAVGIFYFKAGVLGVAVPTLVSRMYGAVYLMIKGSNRERLIHFSLKKVFMFDWSMIKRIFHIAIPSGVENLLFQFVKVGMTSILATFSTSQIAANGVAQTFWNMSFLFTNTFGMTCMTIVGQCMGAKDPDAADYYLQKLTRMAYVGGTVWNLIIFTVSPFILKGFSLTEETRQLAVFVIHMDNIFNMLFCPMAYTLSGGLKAAGDVHFNMFASIFSDVVIRIVVAIVFALKLNLGLIGVTLGMCLSWVVKASLMFMRYKSSKWKTFRVI